MMPHIGAVWFRLITAVSSVALTKDAGLDLRIKQSV